MGRALMVLTLAGALAGAALYADDAAANAEFRAALALEQKGDFRGAANTYVESADTAEDATLKANALLAAATAYGRAGLYEREFRTIERLLDGYSTRVDVVKLISREYELGNAYFKGEREPAFWSLRFIPWLTGPDLTIEIYRRALNRAPFAPEAPQARLRLGYLLTMDGKTTEGAEQFRKLADDYPEAPARKYGLLALGELYFDLSQRGDGDGRYNREALAVFERFEREYPEAEELDLVRKWMLRLRDVQAERLLGLAKYYERTGRREAAQRYLGQVLREYPDSRSAEASEVLLTELDRTYVPEVFQPPLIQREQEYTFHEIPEEPEPLLIAPENSNGKYLLPVYDLRVGAETAAGRRPATPERKEESK